MLPYVEIGPWQLGDQLVVAPYGLLVVSGILAGLAFVWKRSTRFGIPPRAALDAAWFTVVGGLIGSHIGDVLIYEPERLLREGPSALLDVRDLSSIAGFFAGLASLHGYARWRRLPSRALMDLISEALVMGWIFGRLACTIAHDHPGVLSDFPLAVLYPGGARHDLGLYELLLTVAVLAPGLVWLDRQEPPPGLRTAALAVVYGVARFALDFLRARDLPGSDPRIWGLTPSQYGVLLLAAAGIWLGLRIHRDAGVRKGRSPTIP